MAFSPTHQDVQRYRSLRSLSMALGDKLVETIPGQAYEEIGDALGIRRNGVLVFDSEDMASVMADCCLYDWYRNGKNLVQEYAETYPAPPGTDENFLFQAYARAEYRILMVESAVPGAGVHCRDLLNNGELFLMDFGFSQSFRDTPGAVATRTIPLGEFWMTGGAALPIDRETLRQIHRDGRVAEGPAIVSLSIIRACLAAGAADRVSYAVPQAPQKKPRREPRWHPKRRRR